MNLAILALVLAVVYSAVVDENGEFDPDPNRRYRIYEGGWACNQDDEDFTRICGWVLQKGQNSIRFKKENHWDDLNYSPGTYWNFEKFGRYYSILAKYTDNSADGTRTEQKRYWKSSNAWTIDWMELSSRDTGDRWHFVKDPNYPGTFRIYPKRNCPGNTFPCGEVVTYQKNVQDYINLLAQDEMYLKTDTGNHPDNHANFRVVEEIQVL